ncbi:MAG: 4Fe-4S dicluster domain-containing protein [Chloroflexi bacterium]|nr:4Fe-4S dicluster domain-containing protein [Chloroflexota bacterium]
MTRLIEQQLRARAHDLLAGGAVDLFLGYRQGSSPLRVAPFVARAPAEAEKLVWNPLCVPNLAGALRKHAGRRVGLALKACDARSVAELLRLRQLAREQFYIVGVVCHGMADPAQVAASVSGPVSGLVEDGAELLISAGDEVARRRLPALLLAKCAACASPTPELYDELLGEALPAAGAPPADRFAAVRSFEALDPSARLAFWREQFSRCTLCYACQTVCPLCFCKQCPLTLARDDPRRQTREPVSVFAYHLMRAYHLADHCTGCDECERVCPEDIPLSLIYRKLELERQEPQA